MGCGSSSVIRIDDQCSPTPIKSVTCQPTNLTLDSGSDHGFIYTIKSGDETHTLILLKDGRVIVDGFFAESVIYKIGRQEFTFSMPNGGNNSLLSGEVHINGGMSINGVFRLKDASSYVFQGTKNNDSEKVSVETEKEAKGDLSVVIDETTLKKYKDIEKKLDKYQNRELYKAINDMTDKAQDLEVKIKEQIEDIEILKTELNKEERGSLKFKDLQTEIETKCLSLASDQEEYDTTLEYIRTRTSDLFDYNILSEQFDELLHVMFGGESGSDIENQLEAMLEESEAAMKTHHDDFNKEEKIWEDAKGISSLLLQSLNTWSCLEQDGYSESKREFLAKVTRGLLVQIVDNLVSLEVVLKEYEGYPEQTEFKTKLFEFRDNIFIMFETSEGVNEGIETMMFCQTCSREIEQWVYDNLRINEGLDKSNTLKNEALETKLKLKQERTSLMEQWMAEHVGIIESNDVVLSFDEVETDTENEDINGENGDNKAKVVVEEFDITKTYDEIVEKVRERERKSDLQGIRGELELQEKIRNRRLKQRHQRAQKLMEAPKPIQPSELEVR